MNWKIGMMRARLNLIVARGGETSGVARKLRRKLRKSESKFD